MTEIKKHHDFVGDKEGLRRSSPLEIAKYKAGRFKGRSIADLGCGIGVQLTQFALMSHEVIGVERDEKYINYCRRNLEKFNITDLKLIRGDALDPRIIKEVRNYEIINSDPGRVKKGRLWNLSDLSPNPKKIMRKYNKNEYSFDLPVRISKSIIPDNPELEFVSVMGEPKRLLVYYGSLKERDISALSLPSLERVTSGERKTTTQMTGKPEKYVYDLDQILSISGLLGDFLELFSFPYVLENDSQRLLITSNENMNSSFILKKYEIINVYGSLLDLREDLKNYDYGSIYLRFNIPPESYYKVKKELENWATGLEDIYIFHFQDKYYTAIKI